MGSLAKFLTDVSFPPELSELTDQRNPVFDAARAWRGLARESLLAECLLTDPDPDKRELWVAYVDRLYP